MKLSKLSLVLVLLCVVFMVSGEVIELQIDLDAQTVNYAALPLNDNSVVLIEVLDNGLQYTRKFGDSTEKQNLITLENYDPECEVYASLINDNELAVILFKSHFNNTDFHKIIIDIEGNLLHDFPIFSLSGSDSVLIRNDFDDFFIVLGSDVYYAPFRNDIYPELILSDFSTFISNTNLISYVNDNELLIYQTISNNYVVYDISDRVSIELDEIIGVDIIAYEMLAINDVFQLIMYAKDNFYQYEIHNLYFTLKEVLNSSDFIIQINKYSYFNTVYYAPNVYEADIKEALNEDCKILYMTYFDVDNDILVIKDGYEILTVLIDRETKQITKQNSFTATFTDFTFDFAIVDAEYLLLHLKSIQSSELLLIPFQENEETLATVVNLPVYTLTANPLASYSIYSNPNFAHAKVDYFSLQEMIAVYTENTIYFYGVTDAN